VIFLFDRGVVFTILGGGVVRDTVRASGGGGGGVPLLNFNLLACESDRVGKFRNRCNVKLRAMSSVGGDDETTEMP